MGDLGHPLVLVVAAAGYGKTAAVRAWLGERPVRWRRWPEVPPGGLAALVPPDDGPHGRARPAVVIDELPGGGHPAAGPTAADLARAVERLPPSGSLVLLSRDPIRAATRLCDRGLAGQLGPADLALPSARTARLLADEYQVDDPELAERVHRLTVGWPGLVRQVGAELAAGPPTGRGLLPALVTPASRVRDYIVREVLEPLPAALRRLVRDLAQLPSGRAGLCAELGHRSAGRSLARLAATGLVEPSTGGSEPYRLVPLVAAVARARWPVQGTRRRTLLDVAGDWYLARGHLPDAVRASQAAGTARRSADLLEWHADELLAQGGAVTVAAAVPALPARLRTERLHLLLGDALHLLGDPDGARGVYRTVAASEGTLRPGVAWRLGRVSYLKGEVRAAKDALARAALAAEDTADEALVLAWAAAAEWGTGDVQGCGDLAGRALAAAEAAGDPRALGTANVALALHARLTGDRAQGRARQQRALALAEQSRDAAQAARIRVNRAATLLADADFAGVLGEVRPAVRLAEATGNRVMLAVALCNEGAALIRLGRLDAAKARCREAARLCRRLGSPRVAYPLTLLGEIHRRQGQVNRARAAYEEALRSAEAEADQQGLLPALVGLSRVLLADDPGSAARFAERAAAQAVGPAVTPALVALGGVALRRGDTAAAGRHAAEAATSARRHWDRVGLAEALELAAAARLAGPGAGPGEFAAAREGLAEALAMWSDIGAAGDADRVRLRLGRLPGADTEHRLQGRLAELRSPLPAGEPAHAVPAATPIEVRTLGRFDVVVGGTPVPPAGWQSRKARDLLRILVARRGRAVPREELGELLWPGDDPARLGHRLSVALHALRSVLEPERGKIAPALVAGQESIALDLDRVRVDLETFWVDAEYGLLLHRRGEHGDARVLLSAAQQAYQGEFLESEPYEDWVEPLREQARSLYRQVLRVLAAACRDAGDTEEAIAHLLRMLQADPYDEQAHRDLIEVLTASGRHGAARRARQRYRAAMAEIGVRSGRA